MSEEHWISAYRSRPVESLGWYAASLPTSHRLVRTYLKGAMGDAAVIDVGAGASVFADQMIVDGCVDITLLDLSPEALEVTLTRLNRDEAVTSIVGDVLSCSSLRPAGYDVWHDRAVFHFLTRKADRSMYVKRLRQSLAQNGIVVLGTFAEDGPDKCNDLPVRRCAVGQITEDFCPWFDLMHTERQVHVTPSGGQQPFNYFVLRFPEA